MAEDDPDLAEVIALCIAARARIAALEDLDEAAIAANIWALCLREQADAGAGLRSSIIGAIWSRDRLSLAALAQRLGISKAAADKHTKRWRQVPDG